MSCPIVIHAHDKGVEMVRCVFKPLAEEIVEVAAFKYGNPKNKKDTA